MDVTYLTLRRTKRTGNIGCYGELGSWTPYRKGIVSLKSFSKNKTFRTRNRSSFSVLESNIGKVLTTDATYQISRLYDLWFLTKRYFSCFPIKSLCKSLVDVHLVMLHTKYQGSMTCGFRQEDFFMLSLYGHFFLSSHFWLHHQ